MAPLDMNIDYKDMPPLLKIELFLLIATAPEMIW
jgi:hypothetical protein